MTAKRVRALFSIALIVFFLAGFSAHAAECGEEDCPACLACRQLILSMALCAALAGLAAFEMRGARLSRKCLLNVLSPETLFGLKVLLLC